MRLFIELKNIVLLITVAALLSCNSHPLPPITATATNTYTSGRIVWHDLITPDINGSRNFYAKVFGWNFDDFSNDKISYSIIKQNGHPIGMISQLPQNKTGSAQWVGSISVPSVADAVISAKSNGASIIKDATNLKGRGISAFIIDPQGANIGFIHAVTGDPLIAKAAEHEFLGQELWSDNPDASAKFYTATVGYTVENTTVGSIPYTLFKTDGKFNAGMMKNPVQGIQSHWVPYIKVANAKTAIEKARNAGAKILLEPSASVRNGTVGLFLDPSGAPVAVQEYNQ